MSQVLVISGVYESSDVTGEAATLEETPKTENQTWLDSKVQNSEQKLKKYEHH